MCSPTDNNPIYTAINRGYNAYKDLPVYGVGYGIGFLGKKEVIRIPPAVTDYARIRSNSSFLVGLLHGMGR